MKLNSQYGFSIVQGMVVSALLAGSALVTSKLVSDQKKVAVSVKSKDSVDELTEMIYNLLAQQDNCTATITQNGATTLTGNRNLNSGIFVSRKTASDAGLPSQNVVSLNTAYLQNTISVKAMRVEYGTGNLGNLNPAVLVIEMQRNQSKDNNLRTKDGFGGKDLTRRINLVVQRNTAGLTFKSCYAVKTPAEDTGGAGTLALVRNFCNELSPLYTWNNTTNTCDLSDTSCPTGYFFTGVSSTGRLSYGGAGSTGTFANDTTVGAANCRTLRRAIRLSDFITNSPTNCAGRRGVRFIKTGNRVTIGCI